MATMQQVADRAGVSIATVSFVVNGTKYVTPATTARVTAAMRELKFRGNVVARALASRRTRIIALLFPMVPFLLEMIALQRMSRTAYSTFSSLEPAVALVMGMIVIGQAPVAVQLVGMGLVVVAGIGAARGDQARGPAVPERKVVREYRTGTGSGAKDGASDPVPPPGTLREPTVEAA